MKRNYIPHIIIGLIVSLLVALYLFLKAFSPEFSWNEALHKNNTQPYGLNLLYTFIKKTLPEDKFIEVNHADLDKLLSNKQNSTYIYIGSRYFIDSTGIESIINYVKNGNKALIASTYKLDVVAGNWLYCDNYYDLQKSIPDDTITVAILHDSVSKNYYNFHYQVLKESSEYYWPYFTDKFFDLAYFYDPKILSVINDSIPNFVSAQIGEGQLFLHSTPILFSNYHFSSEKGFSYMNEIWELVANDTIIWDSYNSTYHYDEQTNLSESPLRFILKHHSLRWAWYTLIASILLYIIFQSKRKQQVIPLVPVKRNNTMEYAQAVATLYFQSKSHRPIADEMIQQLYSYIKGRYNIKITKDKDAILTKLAKASGIDKKKISELFKLEISLKYNEDADSEQLYKLYNLVDYFYKNCN